MSHPVRSLCLILLVLHSGQSALTARWSTSRLQDEMAFNPYFLPVDELDRFSILVSCTSSCYFLPAFADINPASPPATALHAD